MKNRSISEELMEILKKDYLKITEYVRISPYLDMEMRGNCVMVYYRGGKILTIFDDKKMEGLAVEYHKDKDAKLLVPHIETIEDYFAKAMHIIDIHEAFAKSKLGEKEIQQRVVFENNLSVNADKTDYFVADVEWADNDILGGRADIIAFRWNHMEHRKRLLQLTIIEVKQGEEAIVTSVDNNGKVSAGLSKHYDDFEKLRQDKDGVKALAEDMLVVLKQKKDLGLIKGLDWLFEDSRKNKITPEILPEVDFLFLLSNYHHYSDNLKKELEKLPDEARFISSSFMGYGLYKDFIRSKKDLNLTKS